MLPWTLPVRGRESIKRRGTDSTKGAQIEGSGVHRAFVFGSKSRYRLLELALLAGNALAYGAATAAGATGFWDWL